MLDTNCRLRILILGLNYSPELTGIGKYTGEMARSLADFGHGVRVVTSYPYYPQWRVQKGRDTWRYRREEQDGVITIRCPIWVPRAPTGMKRGIHLMSFALSSLPAGLMQVHWRPHLVMAIAPTIMSAPNALMVARLSGAKPWLHIQDFELEAALGLSMLPSYGRLQSLMRSVEGALFRRFSRVSSISQPMVDRAADKGVPMDHLVLLPNWVDCEEIRPDGFHRQDFGIPEDKFVALYSGNLGAKQGLETLISAACSLKAFTQLHLVICGEGSMRARIESLVGEAPNVQYLPLQPAERLNALLNTADVHLLPQRPEASDLVMPSKLLGMMASGRPSVIAAPDGSELSRIAAEAGVLVPPGDAKAMADAILWLARDPDERKRLGQAARDYVVKNRSRHAVLGKFEAELKDLVASSSPRGPSE
jgi:colanic acid biosynthesis glycosyl transferase WcaI